MKADIINLTTPIKEGAQHELHDFLAESEKQIQAAYDRIQKRVTEDPGTAGDQAEENWAELFREWLPSYFQVVTKGRILAPSGEASPQVDVIVLLPSYPKGLISQKLFLAGGVAAAFECKTTLKSEHIQEALETSAKIQRAMPKREGSPYQELTSPIVFGLLAHSHNWKSPTSRPVEIIGNQLIASDLKFVSHPRESLDVLCVADLGTWTISKMNYMSPHQFPDPAMATIYGSKANTSYICHGLNVAQKKPFFSPLGALFSSLYHKLAWTFPDMRGLDNYFRQVNVMGDGMGAMRSWDLSIYSEKTRQRIQNGECRNGAGFFDEWTLCLM
jgi:hypothetical protein